MQQQVGTLFNRSPRFQKRKEFAKIKKYLESSSTTRFFLFCDTNWFSSLTVLLLLKTKNEHFIHP